MMSGKRRWTADDIPDLSGKVAAVTGANSGLGYEVARGLARHGAHVVLACRSPERGRAAMTRLQAELPRATLEPLALDLADLASVRRCATEFQRGHARLDILVNNAGVMAIPYRETADGLEMQWGVNHLGHFGLTGLLMGPLLNAPGARIVTVSSGYHRRAHGTPTPLAGGESYEKWEAYSRSKLANLLFAFELQRRLEGCGAAAISLAAHPGYAATNLQSRGPRMEGSRLRGWMMALSNRLLAQSAEMGALPILYAATAAEAAGCDYVGPDGLMGLRGYPAKERASAAAYDAAAAAELWEISEGLAGVRYPSC
jgi:NAD(P)-dependent dehydrogenase (short-subunit alcohol dehydrogenase family)